VAKTTAYCGVRDCHSRSSHAAMTSLKIKKGTIYMALSSYEASAKNEISFEKGDEIKVIKGVDEG